MLASTLAAGPDLVATTAAELGVVGPSRMTFAGVKAREMAHVQARVGPQCPTPLGGTRGRSAAGVELAHQVEARESHWNRKPA
jgi:hypothetical protein